jgi:ribosome modulation factor
MSVVIHPRREDLVPSATSRGREDYVAGRPVYLCPYPLGCLDALLWLAAWVQEDTEDQEAILALINERGRKGL